jgi:hypothetical protein
MVEDSFQKTVFRSVQYKPHVVSKNCRTISQLRFSQPLGVAKGTIDLRNYSISTIPVKSDSEEASFRIQPLDRADGYQSYVVTAKNTAELKEWTDVLKKSKNSLSTLSGIHNEEPLTIVVKLIAEAGVLRLLSERRMVGKEGEKALVCVAQQRVILVPKRTGSTNFVGLIYLELAVSDFIISDTSSIQWIPGLAVGVLCCGKYDWLSLDLIVKHLHEPNMLLP